MAKAMAAMMHTARQEDGVPRVLRAPTRRTATRIRHAKPQAQTNKRCGNCRTVRPSGSAGRSDCLMGSAAWCSGQNAAMRVSGSPRAA